MAKVGDDRILAAQAVGLAAQVLVQQLLLDAAKRADDPQEWLRKMADRVSHHFDEQANVAKTAKLIGLARVIADQSFAWAALEVQVEDDKPPPFPQK